MRCEFAIDNNERFATMLEYYKKGWVTDLAVAHFQQQALNNEHRMDTEYIS